MAIYVGVNGANREIGEIWAGVNGVNRKLDRLLAGDNGVNRDILGPPPIQVITNNQYNQPVTKIKDNTTSGNNAYLHSLPSAGQLPTSGNPIVTAVVFDKMTTFIQGNGDLSLNISSILLTNSRDWTKYRRLRIIGYKGPSTPSNASTPIAFVLRFGIDQNYDLHLPAQGSPIMRGETAIPAGQYDRVEFTIEIPSGTYRVSHYAYIGNVSAEADFYVTSMRFE